ncbi:50S ribosomal protein L25/general stress protein Ctc [Demequina sp. NBRC 110051]|uniref:50S ribosomal protein L25/general stress protein Ctc n=1 Tax=Demequina sp. NBRC 110051 TaxID=1570340 RepID=UPI000A06DB67|nr:50S ribosomal protein L25/general stress protein Ctc [Demequina sp. NBRC 110051]
MSDKLVLAAEIRSDFGKGFARRIRANDKIPAVLYGHGAAPVHLTLPGHDTMMALKNSNALLTVQFDGKEELAVPKDVQRHPIKPWIVHVDLLIVKKGEKIVVDIPLHLEGESAPGTIHFQEASTLQVLAEATHLPESFTVSIEGLEEGAKILASDVNLPKGIELAGDVDQQIASIAAPQAQEEDDAAAEEAPAAAEGDEA